MGAFTFAGLAVTSSTKVIFGEVISNPIQLLGQIGGLATTILAIIGISLATITTNIAANVVAPANALVNLNPAWITFRRGAFLNALLGIALFSINDLYSRSPYGAYHYLGGFNVAAIVAFCYWNFTGYSWFFMRTWWQINIMPTNTCHTPILSGLGQNLNFFFTKNNK